MRANRFFAPTAQNVRAGVRVRAGNWSPRFGDGPGGQMPLVSTGHLEKNPLPQSALLLLETIKDVAGGTTSSRKEVC